MQRNIPKKKKKEPKKETEVAISLFLHGLGGNVLLPQTLKSWINCTSLHNIAHVKMVVTPKDWWWQTTAAHQREVQYCASQAKLRYSWTLLQQTPLKWKCAPQQCNLSVPTACFQCSITSYYFLWYKVLLSTLQSWVVYCRRFCCAGFFFLLNSPLPSHCVIFYNILVTNVLYHILLDFVYFPASQSSQMNMFGWCHLSWRLFLEGQCSGETLSKRVKLYLE